MSAAATEPERKQTEGGTEMATATSPLVASKILAGQGSNGNKGRYGLKAKLAAGLTFQHLEGLSAAQEAGFGSLHDALNRHAEVEIRQLAVQVLELAGGGPTTLPARVALLGRLGVLSLEHDDGAPPPAAIRARSASVKPARAPSRAKSARVRLTRTRPVVRLLINQSPSDSEVRGVPGRGAGGHQ